MKSFEDPLDLAAFGAGEGAFRSLPRRVVWKFLQPYVQALLERQVQVERDYDALKKELLAAQRRIADLEERVGGTSDR